MLVCSSTCGINTKSISFSIITLSHNAVENIEVAPLLGDGEEELLWTAAETFTCNI